VTAAQNTEIVVYCEERSHAERRWDIGKFRLIDAGTETATWIALSGPARFKSDQRRRAGEINTMLWLADEKRYLRLGEAIPEGARVRTRPELECEVCGLAFVRKDTTVLFAIFDKLAAAGKTEISLRLLITVADS
jgi:hypothetical protein